MADRMISLVVTSQSLPGYFSEPVKRKLDMKAS